MIRALLVALIILPALASGADAAPLLVGLAGAAVGGALLPAGITIFGSTITGAALGFGIGAIGGSFLQQYLFPPPGQKVEGPRLTDMQIMASTEGAPIPRPYGRVVLQQTQVIWATKFREVVTTTTSGGGKGAPQPKVTTTSYSYRVSFAVGICEGPIAGTARVWADNKLLDLSQVTYRVYRGTEDQEPDPKVIAVEGAENAPAYRGHAYILFEEFALESFGNRPPQLKVEVIKLPPAAGAEERLEDILQAVALIPGSGEFAYETRGVMRDVGLGTILSINANHVGSTADLLVSLDQLAILVPNLGQVALVSAWHGTDLRCGDCEIKPKVEVSAKVTTPVEWQVGALLREDAEEVSQLGGSPSLGGAPSDASVYRAGLELKERGYGVTLYPFILMDIPSGNGLPDPYGGAEQAAYPWRGRITCHPAAGQPGTVDKTATAATQVAAFFGVCEASDFSWDALTQTVVFTGDPDEWSFRRFILHQAAIATAIGVESFIIGSEMIGLTTVRSDADTYPAVAELIALAAECRAILGAGVKIGYAADWTEYNNHRPADGSNDVFFHLDPLWADAEIDFVGIDAYFPLADWRNGSAHADAVAGFRSPYDLAYLQGNIEGGELYDWFYVDQAARDAQTRADITDGAYGEPWVHRFKDIRNWWLNAHHDRPAGVRDITATAWTPEGKPIRIVEVGCPAVDKGANQPNVFFDPKSAESQLPYYSSGNRDDAAQRAYCEAWLSYWEPAAGNNPVSSVYGDRMIDTARMNVWAWDARPYPEFPARQNVWSDAANWRLGHWVNGRLGMARLRDIVAAEAGSVGIAIDVSRLDGVVHGYNVERIMSARAALGPLAAVYFFDGYLGGDTVRFRHRGAEPPAATFTVPDDLVVRPEADPRPLAVTRAQESDLPREALLYFLDVDRDYKQGMVTSRRLAGSTAASITPNYAVAMDEPRAQAVADALLAELHVGRESAQFSLPPSALALEPGDAIVLARASGGLLVRLDEIGHGVERPGKGVRIDPAVYRLVDGPERGRLPPPVPAVAAPLLHFLDLPLLTGAERPHAPHVAGYLNPWTPIAVQRAATEEADYALDVLIEAPTIIGVLDADFFSGPAHRWDKVNTLRVQLPPGQELASADELAVLGGANAAAILTPSGAWEIVQWVTAALVDIDTYELTQLLRGQLGSEHAMGTPTPAGAAFVVLGESLVQSSVPADLRGLELSWRWGPASRAIDDPTWSGDLKTFAGIGLRPYAPVHLTAVWEDDGDIQTGWKRRTRFGGDSWELADVPLNEEQELYEVEILSIDGLSVVRTIEGLGAPAYLYDVADQTADFGGALSSIRYRVFQVSAIFGRGIAAEYP
ncbi:MAG: hypothetical protein GEU91_14220 [Rhizobiales bacterium]|nr:hypothetical protein [Hyphomicrobiales bacterium]